MDRRTFLQTIAAGVVATSARPIAETAPRKAVLISMLPKELSYAERFRVARDAGFVAHEATNGVEALETHLPSEFGEIT